MDDRDITPNSVLFNFGLEGKKYLVTGASSGIGQATAIAISKLGGKVVLNGRNKERLRQTLSQMDGEGHYMMPFDLINLDDIGEFVDTCIKTDGKKFDGMVYSAGISQDKPLRAETIESLHKIMTINFFAYVTLLKAISSRKAMNNGSSIVAVSSGAAGSPDKSQLGYGTSKAALDTASGVAAHELVSKRIRVNTVRPGMVDTAMTKEFFAKTPVDELNARYQLGIIHPEDIAQSIIFFLSDLSSKITGQTVYISGGNYGNGLNFLKQ